MQACAAASEAIIIYWVGRFPYDSEVPCQCDVAGHWPIGPGGTNCHYKRTQYIGKIAQNYYPI
jgi:hypothetical protein